MGGQRHAPAALPPPKTRYQLYSRLGGPPVPLWTVAKNLDHQPSTGIRSPDRPARSQSIYISFRIFFSNYHLRLQDSLTQICLIEFLTGLQLPEDRRQTVFVDVKSDQFPECALKFPMANQFWTYITVSYCSYCPISSGPT